MTYKKCIWILLSILLFTSAFSVVSFALCQFDKTIEDPMAINKECYLRDEAVTKREVSLSNNEQRLVTYKQTEQVTQSEYIDVYTHEQEEYWYGQEGKLTAYYKGSNSLPIDNSEIDQQTAQRIADQHIMDLYGKPNEYTLDSSEYNDSKSSYSVRYTLCVGEENLVYADVCSVTVSKDGQVISSSAPHSEILNGFDKETLNGITREKLGEYALKQINTMYAKEKVKSVELEEVWLQREDDGKFYLLLSVRITKSTEMVIAKELVYALV